MIKTAVYPGSFDPVTNGHLDIIKRACNIFDRLIVAVLANPNKRPLFGADERVKMLETALKGNKKANVDCFEGLLVDYLRKKKINVVIRGLRAVSDLEYEFQIGHINRSLYHKVETVFLMPSEKYVYLTASIVREVSALGGDMRSFVPGHVAGALKIKFRPDALSGTAKSLKKK